MKKLHLKKLPLILYIFSISANTYAADWAILDGNGKTSNLVEMDMSSIQQVASIAKAWVKVTYPKPIEIIQGSKDKYYSVMYRMMMDCKNGRYVFSTSILYSQPRGRGEVLGSTKLNEREAIYQMKDIAPDTVAGVILHYACSPASTKPS